MSAPGIFDRKAVLAHRERAVPLLSTVQPVLGDLAERLLDRLDDTNASFCTALDLGGRGSIAPHLINRGMAVTSTDISRAVACQAGGTPMVVDSETLPFNGAVFDLIVAHFSLHWIDDLPGALIQLRRALKPDGLFLASIPVLGTLHELRTALLEAEHELTGGVNPRVSPFPDLRDCAALLQRAGFILPVADVQDIALLYGNPFDVLRELRAAGETNAVLARSRIIPPRELFPNALARLPQEDGRYRVTLRMAVMTGWGS